MHGAYTIILFSPYPIDLKLIFFPARGSPGRFFAANELKGMMAYIVLTYDVKMVNEGVRPENKWYGPLCVPDRDGEVLFRKRRT